VHLHLTPFSVLPQFRNLKFSKITRILPRSLSIFSIVAGYISLVESYSQNLKPKLKTKTYLNLRPNLLTYTLKLPLRLHFTCTASHGGPYIRLSTGHPSSSSSTVVEELSKKGEPPAAKLDPAPCPPASTITQAAIRGGPNQTTTGEPFPTPTLAPVVLSQKRKTPEAKQHKDTKSCSPR
jgi:hypothetical protein